MRWLAIALAACRFAVAEHAPCPPPQIWPSQLDDVAFDDTRPRLGCVADQGGRSRNRDRGFTHQTWFIALIIGIACLAMIIALYMCGYSAWAVPRTVNGTGHTGPSEFCATSI